MNFKKYIQTLVIIIVGAVNCYSTNDINKNKTIPSETGQLKNLPQDMVIYEDGGNSSTTDGSVSEFKLSPHNFYNIDWDVFSERCHVVYSNGTIGGPENQLSIFLVFKNIKLNKTSHEIQATGQYLGFHQAQYEVNGFTLVLPPPTFEAGNTINIPCYETTVEISLNDYINTDGLDAGLTITDEFVWTLPSGWTTSDSQTGAFVAGPSINLIVPTTPYAPTKGLSVKAKAGNQYSSSATLEVTRNIGDFTISGISQVNCSQTYQYSTQDFSGVSYSWQLPTGWNGSSSSNTIDATVAGATGSITLTATSCNSQTSNATLPIQSIKIIPDNAVFEGSDFLCSSGSTYSITNLFPNSIVSWSNRSSNIGLNSSTSTSANLYAITNGSSGTIKPRITMTCGYDDMNTENVWVGKPDADDFTVYIEELYGDPVSGSPDGPFEVCDNSSYWICLYPYFLFDDQGINDVEFDFDFDYEVLDEGDDYIEITVDRIYEESTGEIYVDSECGYFTFKFLDFVEGNCGWYLMFTPNPTTGETTMSIETNSDKTIFDDSVEWEMEIFSQPKA